MLRKTMKARLSSHPRAADKTVGIPAFLAEDLEKDLDGVLEAILRSFYRQHCF